MYHRQPRTLARRLRESWVLLSVLLFVFSLLWFCTAILPEMAAPQHPATQAPASTEAHRHGHVAAPRVDYPDNEADEEDEDATDDDDVVVLPLQPALGSGAGVRTIPRTPLLPQGQTSGHTVPEATASHGGREESPAPEQAPAVEEARKAPSMVELSGLGVSPDSIATTREDVHILYYAWFANPEFDEDWGHWNHRIEGKEGARGYAIQRFNPATHLASAYMPSRGSYSSKDMDIVNSHMEEIANAGVGVIVIPWWPSDSGDIDLLPDITGLVDRNLPKIVDAAAAHNLKVTFSLEDYPMRRSDLLREDLVYLLSRFRSKMCHRDGRPLFYFSEVTRMASSEWSNLLLPGGLDTIRGTEFDVFAIGSVHLPDYEPLHKMSHVGFEGLYLSDTAGWFNMDHKGECATMKTHNPSLLCVFPISPGKDDTRIHPWSKPISRNAGTYYEAFWKKAFDSGFPIVLIDSYNDWNKGTQIEPAQEMLNYQSYFPDLSNFYMKLTAKWVRITGAKEEGKREAEAGSGTQVA